MKIGIIVALETELHALQAAGVENVVLAGIGKVNAACAATKLILEEHPDCIINSGVAGGIDKCLNVGDFVIGNQFAYHDVWCGEGNLRGQVQGLPQRFNADEALLKVARTLKSEHFAIYEGLIATGDQFLTTLEEDAKVKALYPDALACDMESASIAQVCHRFGVPFLALRAISDVVTPEKNHQELYDNFWNDLKSNSFTLVLEFISAILRG